MKRWHFYAIGIAVVLLWLLWPTAPQKAKVKTPGVIDPADDPSLVIVDTNTGKVLA